MSAVTPLLRLLLVVELIAVWHSASLAWAGQSWAGAAKGLAGMDLWEPAVPSTPSNEWAAVRRGGQSDGF